VKTEVRYFGATTSTQMACRIRLEVRSQAPDQPHQLEVATRFLLKPARRLDAVEVPVEVDLERATLSRHPSK